MARAKSIKDIWDQMVRIEKDLVKHGYGGNSKRFRKVESVGNRYMTNIGYAIGGEMGKRGYYFHDDNYKQYRKQKVSRHVYMGLSIG